MAISRVLAVRVILAGMIHNGLNQRETEDLVQDIAETQGIEPRIAEPGVAGTKMGKPRIARMGRRDSRRGAEDAES